MQKDKRGFTLVELMLVIAVIAILVAIAVPTAFNARKQARIAEALNEVNSIEAAVKAYYEEYGKLPIPADMHNQPEPAYFTGDREDGSKEVINALAGRDESGDEIRNPKGLIFLDVPGIDKMQIDDQDWKGEYPDPWGTQYAIKFDADYSGKVEFYTASDESEKENVDSIAVAISAGPDKRFPGEDGAPDKLTDEVSSYYAPGR